MENYKKQTHVVKMSCGHVEKKELMTTGNQLRIDLAYYARQGLCKECWNKLIKQREDEKREHNGHNF